MKKIILYGMLLAGGVFTSCQVETAEFDSPVPVTARLQVTVEQIGPNLPATTRASVDPVLGEDNVNNLYLLFFQHSNSGSGTFVKAYDILATQAAGADVPLDTDVKLEIGTGQGAGLNHSDDYSILAFANLDDYLGMTPAAFLATLTDKSESAVLKTLLRLPGAGATPIDPADLPMIGRTVKMAGQDLVKVSLTRAVARFDLQNTLRTQYEVTSVAVYNAAKQIYLLSNQQIPGPDRAYTGRYYGSGDAGASVTIKTGTNAGDVTGGLYAFENFQGDPQNKPDSTTALVIGLRSLTETGTVMAPSAGIKYYRVPIAPRESAQSIQRNNVYKVSLRGVLEVGAGSPDAAVDGQVEVTINNWNLDDEGMVITDGRSTMAVPSKIVRLGPEIDTMTYNIFTIGPGTLSITKTNLPNGLKASLSNNTLTVTSTALPGHEERQGTFELGYGGLRGTLTVIQSPDDNLYLTLNRPTLPMFGPAGGIGIVAGGVNAIGGELIQVSASGDWTAKVYNSTADPSDPNNVGFQIDGTKTTWDSSTDGTAPFDIVTTGDNPRSSARLSFVVFTLKADPAYRQVLMLAQDSKAEIRIDPYTETITFDMAGAPKGVMNPRPDNYFELTVDAGTNWDWQLLVGGVVTTATDMFEVTKLGDDKLYIRAAGTNSTTPGLNLGEQRNAVLRITRPGATTVEIGLVHEKFEFEVEIKPGSPLTRVPVDGAHTNVLHKIYNPGGIDPTVQSRYAPEDFANYVAITVKDAFPASLQWEAKIVEYSHSVESDPTYVGPEHKGYIVDGTGTTAVKKYSETVEGGKNTELHVSFDKVYYPIVHFKDAPNTPWVKVRFNIKGKPSLTAECTVYQDPLVAKTLYQNILAFYGGIYGQLGGDGNFMRPYRNSITSSTDFGPSGTVKTPAAITTSDFITSMTVDAQGVSNNPGVGYIHGTGNDGTGAYTNTYNGETNYGFKAIERWRNHYEGFFLLTLSTDQRNSGFFNNNESTIKILGWQSQNEATSNNYRANGDNADKRVMKFLTNGPFGKTSSSNFAMYDQFATDGTALKRSSLTPNAVEVVTWDKNSTEKYAMVVIDPENRMIYISEPEAFISYHETWDYSGPYRTNDHLFFTKNLAAITMNGLMYGSHFYDTLREDFYPAGTPDANKHLWILGGRNGSGEYPCIDLNASTQP